MMRKIENFIHLEDHMRRLLVDERLFMDDVVEERLFPEAFSRLFKESKLADIVILSRDLYVQRTFINGTEFR